MSHNRSSLAVEAPPTVRLDLLEGFQLRRRDEPVGVAPSGQRLVAFLALHDRPLRRLYVAGTLWPEKSEEHANACLRTALWRLPERGSGLVESSSTHVGLARTVHVDVREQSARAHRVLALVAEPGDLAELCAAGDLLPDWYDDWVLIERERFRQLRLHALESLCEAATAAGRFADAAEAGLAAIANEPLRESAHRVLIMAYLAQENPVEAIRQYRLYRDLVRDQLGLDPSARIQELVGAFGVA